MENFFFYLVFYLKYLLNLSFFFLNLNLDSKINYFIVLKYLVIRMFLTVFFELLNINCFKNLYFNLYHYLFCFIHHCFNPDYNYSFFLISSCLSAVKYYSEFHFIVNFQVTKIIIISYFYIL